MRIVICGRGGQGVITLNMLIGYLASALGHKTVSAETHGMAMRGGSVNTSLKIGEGFSASIEEGGADLLLSTDCREVERNLKFLRKDGLIITDGEYSKEIPFRIQASNYQKIATEKFGGASQTSSIIMGEIIRRYPEIFPFDKSVEILKSNKKINIDAILYGAGVRQK